MRSKHSSLYASITTCDEPDGIIGRLGTDVRGNFDNRSVRGLGSSKHRQPYAFRYIAQKIYVVVVGMRTCQRPNGIIVKVIDKPKT